MNNPTPRNAQQANEQAKRFQKAQTMKAEGYRMEYATKDCFDVYKPGNFVMPDYTVDMYRNTCDCPDAKKGNVCKHQYFVEMELDAQANMEAQCALWEDQNYPLVPEMPAPTLTVAAVLEALQARIVQDMDRAEAVMLQRDIQCFAVKNDRIRRFEHLQGALHIINDCWTKERANLLDLTPAETVTL